MSPDQLLEHFDRISEAPEAIARLRQFILELAVRGKLIDQDEKSESTDELLTCIAKEKAKRLKNGQVKAKDLALLSPVSDDEAWFNIPTNWRWERLGCIAELLMGTSPPGDTYNKSRDGVPLINGPVEFTEGPFGETVVNQYTTSPTVMCEKGDLLICVRGSTTGRTNIAGFKACIGRGVAAIRPYFDSSYVQLFIWRLRASIIAMGRGIAFPSVSKQQLFDLPIPLPPLAEQKRIVAKVDELMGLCDRLEAAQQEREALRDKASAASLARLSEPAEDAPTFREHAQFHLTHLPRFTTRPDQIASLRQTILSLAVRGKLVPQNPSDEPASKILGQISNARRSASAIKQQTELETKDSPATLTDDWPIPQTWNWTTLSTVAESRLGKMLDKNKNKGQLRRYLRNTNVRWFDFDLSDLSEMRIEEKELTEFALHNRDVLICEGGEPGRAAVWDNREDEIYFQKAIHRVRFHGGINPYFFVYVLKHDAVSKRLDKYFTGTGIKHFTGKELSQYRFPVPPMAEQKRIVSKVNELMALCDQLEASLATQQTENARLLEAILHEALAPA